MNARLEEVAEGIFAYLQRGSWGYNNAGLVEDGERALLVDTLFDPRLTAQMLRTMRAASATAEHIDVVVNTHANGDHCWGNQLVSDAEIVASTRGAAEMRELAPKQVALLLRLARMVHSGGTAARLAVRVLGTFIPRVRTVGHAADFIVRIFGDFALDEVELTPPTRTFDGTLTLAAHERRVELFEVGPAHTEGDVLVFVPDAKTLFSGDILFIESHPVMWAGPVQNWIDACDEILALAPEVIIPGHGPPTNALGVRAVRSYLTYLRDESRVRYDAGMSAVDAAHDIALGAFSTWGERERVIVNVKTLYREFAGVNETPDPVVLFADMAEFLRR